MSTEQMSLFDVSYISGVPETHHSVSRFAHARDKRYVPLAPHDVLDRAFTYPFRWQLAYTIGYLTETHRFELASVLTPDKIEFLNYCSFPHQGRYFSIAEIMAQTTGDPKAARFKSRLGWTFARVWRRAMVGTQAMETLLPSDYLYFTIIKYGHKETIDQLGISSPEEVARMCPTIDTYDELTRLLLPHFPDLVLPRPLYPSEHPPEEFFR